MYVSMLCRRVFNSMSCRVYIILCGTFCARVQQTTASTKISTRPALTGAFASLSRATIARHCRHQRHTKQIAKIAIAIAPLGSVQLKGYGFRRRVSRQVLFWNLFILLDRLSRSRHDGTIILLVSGKTFDDATYTVTTLAVAVWQSGSWGPHATCCTPVLRLRFHRESCREN